MKHLPRYFLAVCVPFLSVAAADNPVEVWLTTGDATQVIAEQPRLVLGTEPANSCIITINDRDRHQAIVGFGASLVEPALENISAALRKDALARLFDPATGLGLGFIRIQLFNDLEQPGDEALTPEQRLAAYRQRLADTNSDWRFRMVRDARRLNPDLRVMGSPWTAPAWMKDSGKAGHGQLLPKWRTDYADLYVQWIKAWQAAGIPVTHLTLQNEPQFEPGWYQGMRMEVPDQIAFARVLGQALEAAGLNTTVLCHDHNWDDPDRPVAIMNDPQASRWLAGAAFHGYGGDPWQMRVFAQAHPDTDIYNTELTGSYPGTGWGGSMQWQVTRPMSIALQQGSRSAMLWQLVRQCGTDKGDRPVLRIDPETEKIEVNGEYAVLGHFSRFVQRGAKRIGCSSPGGEQPYAVAFQNPDGSKILVANSWGRPATIAIHDGATRFSYDLPLDGVATFRWHDIQSSPAATPELGGGLRGTYHDSANLTTVKSERIDGPLVFDWNTTAPDFQLSREHFSVRWTGMIRSPKTGPVAVHLRGDDGIRVWIDGEMKLDAWKTRAASTDVAEIDLGPVGTWKPIVIEYFQGKGQASFSFSWSPDGGEPVPVPRSALLPDVVEMPGSGTGLSCMLWDGVATTSPALAASNDADLERDWTLGLPGTSDVVKAQWSGTLVADRTGEIEFELATDARSTVTLNGRKLLQSNDSVRTARNYATVQMVAGTSYPILITTEVHRRKAQLDNTGFTLRWRLGDERFRPIPVRQLSHASP